MARQPKRVKQSSHTWEKIGAFAFGLVFLTTCLAIAWFRPSPSEGEYRVYATVLALSAAGIGAILSGFIDIRYKNQLRAGGGLALFVIVYFFAPAVPKTMEKLGVVPQIDPIPTAVEWLQRVDRKEIGAAYNSMGEEFTKVYPLGAVSELLTRERNTLGQLKSRTFQGAGPIPNTNYHNVYFLSQYSGEPRVIGEQIVLAGEKDNWKVVGFFTYVRNQFGMWESYMGQVPQSAAPLPPLPPEPTASTAVN